MGGPKKHYAKLNISIREKQMLFDFTYMWQLENETNEQIKLKQTQIQKKKLWLPKGEWLEIGQNK